MAISTNDISIRECYEVEVGGVDYALNRISDGEFEFSVAGDDVISVTPGELLDLATFFTYVAQQGR